MENNDTFAEIATLESGLRRRRSLSLSVSPSPAPWARRFRFPKAAILVKAGGEALFKGRGELDGVVMRLDGGDRTALTLLQ